MSSAKNEVQLTSAIENMSVADVRKALSQMRKKWQKHSCIHPFFPSHDITTDMTVSEFSFRFVMGHHEKRHQKSNDLAAARRTIREVTTTTAT